MDSTGHNTLYNTDKIQMEIKQTLDREDELKNSYSHLYNGNSLNNNENSHKQNDSLTLNGTDRVQKTNGDRRYTPNMNTKGVMQKFFKTHGRVSLPSIKATETQSDWISDATFQPAKISVEKHKPLRKGFVPAEEKIVKELQEFQRREAELRKERRRSQPSLMASLKLEEAELELENHFKDSAVLKPAKSVANLYEAENEVQQNNSAPSSLKPARSLAALCDLSDDEIEMPGTHSLIMQFENMKGKEARF